MYESPSGRPFDLLDRTSLFAKQVRALVKLLPRTDSNVEDIPQLIRSSGSVGANYIEANEALGKKDFLLRMRTARKEAKESAYWLRLLDFGTDPVVAKECERLAGEASELVKIFSAIIRKKEGEQ